MSEWNFPISGVLLVQETTNGYTCRHLVPGCGTDLSDQIFPDPFTHLFLACHKRDTGKLFRSRSDAAERGVCLGSSLFALSPEISVINGNNKKQFKHPLNWQWICPKREVEESTCITQRNVSHWSPLGFDSLCSTTHDHKTPTFAPSRTHLSVRWAFFAIEVN